MIEAWKQWEGHTVDGRFPLVHCLAGSGHAAVFLTEYGAPEPRKAAIKLIQVDPESVERHLARWRSAAALRHPHLLPLYESGSFDSGDRTLLYVVTEYAEENLSRALAHQPLTIAEVDQTLKPVLAALSYLHSNGYTHARLKPANVLATGDQVKLSVDGVRQIGDPPGSNPPSIYDAPELAQTGASPAADVWALGVVLAECFTGNPPSPERLRSGEPLEPGTAPEPFLEIVRRCIEKDASHRWTVSEIESHLRQASGSPHEPAHSPTKTTIPRYARVAAVAGLALLAVLAGSRLIDPAPVPDTASGALDPPATQTEAELSPPVPAPLPESPPEPPPAARRIDPPPAPKPTPLPAARETATPSGDFVPGEVVRRVLPDVPANARNTITGRVRVQVAVGVNASGQVEATEIENRGPSAYFAELALDAARRWEFTPAQAGGQAVPSRWLIHFVFTRNGTDVRPQPVTSPSG